MRYKAYAYQRTGGAVGYGVALAVAAVSFGIGFFANKYFSEREINKDRTSPRQRRDGTIESIVVDSDNIIMCTEEDIRVTDHLFGITPKTR